jgi:hypothetical protein
MLTLPTKLKARASAVPTAIIASDNVFITLTTSNLKRLDTSVDIFKTTIEDDNILNKLHSDYPNGPIIVSAHAKLTIIQPLVRGKNLTLIQVMIGLRGNHARTLAVPSANLDNATYSWNTHKTLLSVNTSIVHPQPFTVKLIQKP